MVLTVRRFLVQFGEAVPVLNAHVHSEVADEFVDMEMLFDESPLLRSRCLIETLNYIQQVSVPVAQVCLLLVFADQIEAVPNQLVKIAPLVFR